MGEALLSAATSAFAKKGAEAAGNGAINTIVDFSKKKFGEAQVSLGTAFTLYLKNARQRYNQIKTIATGTQPRAIIGENPLYVQIGVSYQETEYSTQTIEKLLPIGNHLLIEGTGGAGKSMLMRYLFLDTAYRGAYVPILLELRRLSSLSGGSVSLATVLELVYARMRDFDVQLDAEQFEYSLRSGKYLFLLDGFDEIPETLAREAADAIQNFCAKYPNNPCVVTSRPREHTAPLETFSVLQAMPLKKAQAVMLASRLWDEDEKTTEFCDQLDKELFDRHEDFAKNPLLLTMMFLTFMRSGSIPDHLCDFYQKAYDALYSAHDNQDKGVYKREFKCKTLDEQSFTRLFSYFCFQSYFKSDYEFTEEELLGYLDKGVQKLGLADVNARDYLKDLQSIVCMLVREGGLYRFSHRSFQAYFAAVYTCGMTDDVQKRWFENCLAMDYLPFEYCDLLYQLSQDRFAANALEDGLRTLLERVDRSPEPDLCFLKTVFDGVRFFISSNSSKIYYTTSSEGNLVALFRRFIGKKLYHRTINRTDHEKKALDILQNEIKRLHQDHQLIYFDEIDLSPDLTDEERKTLYHAMIEYYDIASLRSSIRQWLSEQDAKRQRLEASSDRDALLDAL